MQKWTKKKLDGMLAIRGDITPTYKPFPGRVPSRLRINIYGYDQKRDKRFCIFRYHGKFSSAILEKASKIAWARVGEIGLLTEVIEYHQNGPLMTGTFTDVMNFFQHHNLAHYDSPAPVPQRMWRVAHWRPVKEVAVRCGGFSVYVPPALLLDGRWENRVRTMRRRREERGV